MTLDGRTPQQRRHRRNVIQHQNLRTSFSRTMQSSSLSSSSSLVSDQLHRLLELEDNYLTTDYLLLDMHCYHNSHSNTTTNNNNNTNKPIPHLRHRTTTSTEQQHAIHWRKKICEWSYQGLFDNRGSRDSRCYICAAVVIVLLYPLFLLLFLFDLVRACVRPYKVVLSQQCAYLLVAI